MFLVFFAGWGAYQAIDWALALKVLPRSETAGKDMGIWHVALVLPQILGPAVTGWIITGAKLAVSARFAYALAFAIAALWFSLSALLVARVRLAAIPPPDYSAAWAAIAGAIGERSFSITSQLVYWVNPFSSKNRTAPFEMNR